MQRPSALGLFLCDQVIVDRDSGRRTPFNLFEAVNCTEFPVTLKNFDVYANLTDGQGRMRLALIVSDVETGDQILNHTVAIELPDPLAVAHVRFRLRDVSFPTAGQYLFELSVEGEIICHRRLNLNYVEEQP